jgi:hypothetical protein
VVINLNYPPSLGWDKERRNEMREIDIRQDEGKVTFEMTPDEARRLRAFLDRKASGVQKPKMIRSGNKLILDTGLDDGCILGKGTKQEIHALRIHQRAGSHQVDAAGEVIPESVIPALTIVETTSGNYVYLNNEFVNNRKDLEIIAKQHRGQAYRWFDSRYGKKSDEPVEASEPEPSNESVPTSEEPELELKEKIIILLAKNVQGKEIAKLLRCSAGLISIHKKAAIKNKILSKDGRTLTPEGQERYGGIELNL